MHLGLPVVRKECYFFKAGFDVIFEPFILISFAPLTDEFFMRRQFIILFPV